MGFGQAAAGVARYAGAKLAWGALAGRRIARAEGKAFKYRRFANEAFRRTRRSGPMNVFADRRQFRTRVYKWLRSGRKYEKRMSTLAGMKRRLRLKRGLVAGGATAGIGGAAGLRRRSRRRGR